jgi:hypothetical protein
VARLLNAMLSATAEIASGRVTRMAPLATITFFSNR